MTEVVARNHADRINLSKEPPRSPIIASPASRRSSMRPSGLANGSEPPTPTSPSPRLTRKRAASINTDAANHPNVKDLALNSADIVTNVSGAEKVCLCQPDPKIPRPRNAFILYRQHYQAQIVARHPGLANPEISKIIGEQWRDQPAEVKNEWKRLAEEEKHRHQRQYPDYRYQPRRAGLLNRNRRVSSSEDHIRCPKCNGRYISTPSTPITPSTPSVGGRNDRLLPPFTSSLPSGPTHGNMSRNDRAHFPGAAMSAPTSAPPYQQAHRCPLYAQQIPGALRLGSPRKQHDDLEMAEASPEFKRRRFNDGPPSHPSPLPYDSGRQRGGRPPISAVGYIDERMGQLPIINNQRSGVMEPPPCPSPVQHQFSKIQTPHSFDESLRLPPLQTLGPHSGYGPSRTNPHQRNDSQARSVEAMVMTIPYINKIKVLAKISPPLSPPGPTSPVQQVRGVVIAVEGVETSLTTEVGNFIEDYLKKEPECLVKTWLTYSGKRKSADASGDSEMGGTNTPPIETSKFDNPFLDYLKIMQAWHERGREITDYMTTRPLPSIAAATAASPTPLKNTAPAPMSPPTTTTNPASSTTRKSSDTSSTPENRIPVALLPHGFSLSTSDRAASSIPINDAYAPVDHWQWMATLWRGIIGPDLTIYVKFVFMEERDAAEEMAKFGGVEVVRGCSAIVVRVPVGRDEHAVGDGKQRKAAVEEKTLRRLGFEVMEFVRGGMFGVKEA